MVRRTLLIIGLLWIVTIAAVAYLYIGGYFAPYMSRFEHSADSLQPGSFKLESSAFENGGSIPAQYTCDEKQISPPLSISGAPQNAKSFALIVEDRDVPKNLKPDGVFLHWVVFNIPAGTTDIGVGEIAGVQGASDNGVAGYVGPCPPPQYEPAEHRYYFDLYALDTTVNLPEGADVSALKSAMEGHIVSKATLLGRYARQTR